MQSLPQGCFQGSSNRRPSYLPQGQTRENPNFQQPKERIYTQQAPSSIRPTFFNQQTSNTWNYKAQPHLYQPITQGTLPTPAGPSHGSMPSYSMATSGRASMQASSQNYGVAPSSMGHSGSSYGVASQGRASLQAPGQNYGVAPSPMDPRGSSHAMASQGWVPMPVSRPSYGIAPSSMGHSGSSYGAASQGRASLQAPGQNYGVALSPMDPSGSSHAMAPQGWVPVPVSRPSYGSAPSPIEPSRSSYGMATHCRTSIRAPSSDYRTGSSSKRTHGIPDRGMVSSTPQSSIVPSSVPQTYIPRQMSSAPIEQMVSSVKQLTSNPEHLNYPDIKIVEGILHVAFPNETAHCYSLSDIRELKFFEALMSLKQKAQLSPTGKKIFNLKDIQLFYDIPNFSTAFCVERRIPISNTSISLVEFFLLIEARNIFNQMLDDFVGKITSEVKISFFKTLYESLRLFKANLSKWQIHDELQEAVNSFMQVLLVHRYKLITPQTMSCAYQNGALVVTFDLHKINFSQFDQWQQEILREWIPNLKSGSGETIFRLQKYTLERFQAGNFQLLLLPLFFKDGHLLFQQLLDKVGVRAEELRKLAKDFYDKQHVFFPQNVLNNFKTVLEVGHPPIEVATIESKKTLYVFNDSIVLNLRQDHTLRYRMAPHDPAAKFLKLAEAALTNRTFNDKEIIRLLNSHMGTQLRFYDSQPGQYIDVSFPNLLLFLKKGNLILLSISQNLPSENKREIIESLIEKINTQTEGKRFQVYPAFVKRQMIEMKQTLLKELKPSPALLQKSTLCIHDNQLIIELGSTVRKYAITASERNFIDLLLSRDKGRIGQFWELIKKYPDLKNGILEGPIFINTLSLPLFFENGARLFQEILRPIVGSERTQVIHATKKFYDTIKSELNEEVRYNFIKALQIKDSELVGYPTYSFNFDNPILHEHFSQQQFNIDDPLATTFYSQLKEGHVNLRILSLMIEEERQHRYLLPLLFDNKFFETFSSSIATKDNCKKLFKNLHDLHSIPPIKRTERSKLNLQVLADAISKVESASSCSTSLSMAVATPMQKGSANATTRLYTEGTQLVVDFGDGQRITAPLTNTNFLYRFMVDLEKEIQKARKIPRQLLGEDDKSFYLYQDSQVFNRMIEFSDKRTMPVPFLLFLVGGEQIFNNTVKKFLTPFDRTRLMNVIQLLENFITSFPEIDPSAKNFIFAKRVNLLIEKHRESRPERTHFYSPSSKKILWVIEGCNIEFDELTPTQSNLFLLLRDQKKFSSLMAALESQPELIEANLTYGPLRLNIFSTMLLHKNGDLLLNQVLSHCSFLKDKAYLYIQRTYAQIAPFLTEEQNTRFILFHQTNPLPVTSDAIETPLLKIETIAAPTFSLTQFQTSEIASAETAIRSSAVSLRRQKLKKSETTPVVEKVIAFPAISLEQQLSTSETTPVEEAAIASSAISLDIHQLSSSEFNALVQAQKNFFKTFCDFLNYAEAGKAEKAKRAGQGIRGLLLKERGFFGFKNQKSSFLRFLNRVYNQSLKKSTIREEGKHWILADFISFFKIYSQRFQDGTFSRELRVLIHQNNKLRKEICSNHILLSEELSKSVLEAFFKIKLAEYRHKINTASQRVQAKPEISNRVIPCFFIQHGTNDQLFLTPVLASFGQLGFLDGLFTDDGTAAAALAELDVPINDTGMAVLSPENLDSLNIKVQSSKEIPFLILDEKHYSPSSLTTNPKAKRKREKEKNTTTGVQSKKSRTVATVAIEDGKDLDEIRELKKARKSKSESVTHPLFKDQSDENLSFWQKLWVTECQRVRKSLKVTTFKPQVHNRLIWNIPDLSSLDEEEPHAMYMLQAKPYQEAGINYIDCLNKLGISGILAWWMGLGKTLGLEELIMRFLASTDCENVLVLMPNAIREQMMKEAKERVTKGKYATLLASAFHLNEFPIEERAIRLQAIKEFFVRSFPGYQLSTFFATYNMTNPELTRDALILLAALPEDDEFKQVLCKRLFSHISIREKLIYLLNEHEKYLYNSSQDEFRKCRQLIQEGKDSSSALRSLGQLLMMDPAYPYARAKEDVYPGKDFEEFKRVAAFDPEIQMNPISLKEFTNSPKRQVYFGVYHELASMAEQDIINFTKSCRVKLVLADEAHTLALRQANPSKKNINTQLLFDRLQKQNCRVIPCSGTFARGNPAELLNLMALFNPNLMDLEKKNHILKWFNKGLIALHSILKAKEIDEASYSEKLQIIVNSYAHVSSLFRIFQKFAVQAHPKDENIRRDWQGRMPIKVSEKPRLSFSGLAVKVVEGIRSVEAQFKENGNINILQKKLERLLAYGDLNLSDDEIIQRIHSTEDIEAELRMSPRAYWFLNNPRVKEALKNKKRIIAFSHHDRTARIVEAFVNRLYNANTYIYNGNTKKEKRKTKKGRSANTREAILAEFSKAKDVPQVLFLSLGTGAFGLNCPYVDTVVMLEGNVDAVQRKQAKWRHIRGNSEPVNKYVVALDDLSELSKIEEKRQAILVLKKAFSKFITKKFQSHEEQIGYFVEALASSIIDDKLRCDRELNKLRLEAINEIKSKLANFVKTREFLALMEETDPFKMATQDAQEPALSFQEQEELERALEASLEEEETESIPSRQPSVPSPKGKERVYDDEASVISLSHQEDVERELTIIEEDDLAEACRQSLLQHQPTSSASVSSSGSVTIDLSKEEEVLTSLLLDEESEAQAALGALQPLSYKVSDTISIPVMGGTYECAVASANFILSMLHDPDLRRDLRVANDSIVKNPHLKKAIRELGLSAVPDQMKGLYQSLAMVAEHTSTIHPILTFQYSVEDQTYREVRSVPGSHKDPICLRETADRKNFDIFIPKELLTIQE